MKIEKVKIRDIKTVEKELAELYDDALVSDLANARYIELQDELRALKNKEVKK